MTLMIIGLVLFLGVHSLNLFAPQWRQRQLAQRGEKPFKAVYGLISLAGLVVAVYGYGDMRASAGAPLWNPPVGLRHGVSLLMLPAFIFLLAAYIPHNHIKARLGHPMLLAVKTWALSHLLVNARLGDMVFFGAFLAWAVALYVVLRRRDRAAGTVMPAGTLAGTAGCVIGGAALWFAFARYLHVYVAGVPVFG